MAQILPQQFLPATNQTYNMSSIYPIDSSGHIVVSQNVDTRNPGTVTPATVTFTPGLAQGDVTVKWTAYINRTTCQIGAASYQNEMPVIALACMPEWLRASQPNGPFIHLNPSTISIRISPSMNQRMKDGLVNAINAWNNVLDDYPNTPVLSPYFSETACGGSTCVNAVQDNIPAGDECAAGVINYDSGSGLITGGTITFPSASAAWPQAFDNRLGGHELGHLLGLKNNDTSCPTAESLMRPVTCGATGGFPQAPTASDANPVGRSVYNNHSTYACPAQ